MVNGFKESLVFKESITLVLAESVLLVFEPQKQLTPAEQYGSLLSWFDLHSLYQLKRKLSTPNIISLFWKSSKIVEERYVLKENDIFVKKLLDNMERLGADIECNRPAYINTSAPKIEELENILNEIEYLEKCYYDENLQGENMFMELVKSYQKAVEYYSAIGDESYKIWMEKTQTLIRNKNLRSNY